MIKKKETDGQCHMSPKRSSEYKFMVSQPVPCLTTIDHGKY